MYREILITTRAREEFVNITSRVAEIVSTSQQPEGLCYIHVPHTTAGITINENADPDVTVDILEGLRRIVPASGYLHGEGNSPAHIKASLVGTSLVVMVEKGRLQMGTWQGIYLCEFDGPRQRRVWITVR
ncbi:MAG TPA: secondary thiamine-phosphate synthase enzyme YjbQ [Atribacteraceae bacterium]|nr:secondary thiamine-phosphate synthase enzyme YjbQ [Atribacteraceae bacterium]